MMDPLVADWVLSKIGEFEVTREVAHAHGYSRLWRLRTANGPVWLKCHRFPHKAAGEAGALGEWRPPLAPRLLARRTGPDAMLFNEIPGRCADDVPLSPVARARLWREAGTWLRAFHARENATFGLIGSAGTPDAAAPLVETLANRLRSGRENGVLTPAEGDFVAAGLRDLPAALTGERPRAAHRDFSPRNWMTDESGALLGVLDFEHARWDVPAYDLSRPYALVAQPDWEAPFHEGYGGPVNEAAVFAMRLYQAANGAVWAWEVDDLPFMRTNLAALRRLMATT